MSEYDALAQYQQPLDLSERPPYLNQLLFGHHKVGKTVLAAHRGAKVLLIACDGGWVSLRDWDDELGKVDVVQYQSLNHLKLLSKAIRFQEPPYDEYDHVIVDPISTAVSEFVSYLQDEFSPSGPQNRVTWTPKSGSKEKSFTTSGPTDFNAVLQHFRGPILRLNAAPVDVTYIAHVKDPSFMNPKDRTIKPNLPQGVSGLLAKEVGIIGYVELKGGKRTVSMRASEEEDSGSWLRKLHGKVVTAEQYPEIIRKWKEGTL